MRIKTEARLEDWRDGLLPTAGLLRRLEEAQARLTQVSTAEAEEPTPMDTGDVEVRPIPSQRCRRRKNVLIHPSLSTDGEGG
jgi:hypothetical protein